MKKTNVRTFTSLFCALLLVLLFLSSFSGCSQTGTKESPRLQVCFEGPFGGHQFSDCTTAIQQQDFIHLLQLKSNQIFSIKANKGISADGFNANRDHADYYYLHTVGSLLPIQEKQNLVLDFDFVNDSLLTLEILNPSIFKVERKIIGCLCFMTSDGLIVGHQDIQTQVVLHSPSPVTLLKKDSVYDIEVVDHRFLIVLWAAPLQENQFINMLSVYLITDLLNNQYTPLYGKAFDHSTQNQESYHHCLVSNKQDLFSVLTYADTLETYALKNNEIVFMHEMPISFSRDTKNPLEYKNLYMVCPPYTDQVLVWNESPSTTDQYVRIIDIRSNTEFQTVEIPKEEFTLEYAMPFSNQKEKGYFLFYKNEDTNQTISTYLVLP